MRQADRLKETATEIHSAAIRLLRHLRKTDVSSGVGPAKLSALSVLVYGGPRTLAALAEAEQVKPPTMTRIVNGLTERGLVKKSVVKDDRRSCLLRVTARGKALLEKARRARMQELESMFSTRTKEELNILQASARLIHEMLEGRSK